MSDDVARFVGARSPKPVTICGKECLPRPMTIREITELERDCLERYKTAYIKTFADNAKLLPPEMQRSVIVDEMRVAAKFDLATLPAKFVYDGRLLRVTDELKAWLSHNLPDYDQEIKEAKEKEKDLERIVVNAAITALDTEHLSLETYKELTKGDIKRTKVPYVNWWTSTFDGMISMIWLTFRDIGITREELVEDLGKRPTLLADISREIEMLTAPKMGNG